MNKKVLVIDNQNPNSSSKVAAGVFNPITGRRLVTTWKAKEVFSYFPEFYKALERETHEVFFNERPIYRAFQSVGEQNDWSSKPSHEIPDFVQDIFTTGQYPSLISDDLGGIYLRNGGFLDTQCFITAAKKWLVNSNSYCEAQVKLEDISWKAPFNVMDFTSERLILCMGFAGCEKTPFGNSPFNPVKGETLEISTHSKLPEVIFNGPVFLLKQKNNLIRIGSTYDFDDKSFQPTAKARDELIGKINSFFRGSYKIEDQTAGIRPSSVDRRPVVGEHPEIQGLGILNGLGTKGVSLAPYISKLLVQYFENGKELDREIDIKRFFK